MNSLEDHARAEAIQQLSQFRRGFYQSLTRRADALFELAEAVLCADGPVKTLVDLSLAPEHRRGHGALYDGLNRGRLDVARFRAALAGLRLPRAVDGRIVLAVDVSPWLRPDACTSPDRLFCHVSGRAKSAAQFIPGWPYSLVAALEVGRTSWTALLDAVRLGPDDDQTAVTALQVREVIDRLVTAGQWQDGDPDILIVLDAGYDVTRLAFLLADLPVQLLGRMRSDRVLRLPAPPRRPGTGGRPAKHGGEFRFADPATWPDPHHTTTTQTTRYGTAVASSWDRLHPRLTHRAAWLDHEGALPIIEGTVIRLQVDQLPGGGDPTRSGCGGRAPAPPQPTSTGSGRRSCGGLILSTPSDSVSRRWAGPHPRSATPRPPTAGPGCSSPAIPSSASPGRSPAICADHGNDPPRPVGSPRPGSGEGSGTSARRLPAQPVHQNPASPALDAHPAPPTAVPQPVTTSGKRSNARPHSPPDSGRQLKRQVEGLFEIAVALLHDPLVFVEAQHVHGGKRPVGVAG